MGNMSVARKLAPLGRWQVRIAGKSFFRWSVTGLYGVWAKQCLHATGPIWQRTEQSLLCQYKVSGTLISNLHATSKYVRVCPLQYPPLPPTTTHHHPPAVALPNEFERTSGASSLNGHIVVSCHHRGFYIRKLLAAIIWAKGPSPDLKRSSLVYGILTCIGSLGLLNSSQNRTNSSKMASRKEICTRIILPVDGAALAVYRRNGMHRPP